MFLIHNMVCGSWFLVTMRIHRTKNFPVIFITFVTITGTVITIIVAVVNDVFIIMLDGFDNYAIISNTIMINSSQRPIDLPVNFLRLLTTFMKIVIGHYFTDFQQGLKTQFSKSEMLCHREDS